MNIVNTILSAGTALVDGKFTGLAGCGASSQCPKHSNCLRADARLTVLFENQEAGGDCCQFFIPVVSFPKAA